MNEKEFRQLLRETVEERAPAEVDLWPALAHKLPGEQRLSRTLRVATGVAGALALLLVAVLFVAWMGALSNPEPVPAEAVHTRPSVQPVAELFPHHQNAVYVAPDDNLPLKQATVAECGVTILSNVEEWMTLQPERHFEIVYLHPEAFRQVDPPAYLRDLYLAGVVIVVLYTPASSISPLLPITMEDLRPEYFNSEEYFTAAAFQYIRSADGNSSWVHRDFYLVEEFKSLAAVVERQIQSRSWEAEQINCTEGQEIVDVEPEYETLSRQQLIERSDAIFVATVVHVGCDAWTQDNGQYWESENERALLKHQLILTVNQVLLDNVDLEEAVILAVFGNSPVGLASPEHDLQASDQIVVYAARREIPWYQPDPTDAEIRSTVLTFTGTPTLSYLRHEENDLYSPPPAALPSAGDPVSIEQLIQQIAAIRPDEVHEPPSDPSHGETGTAEPSLPPHVVLESYQMNTEIVRPGGIISGLSAGNFSRRLMAICSRSSTSMMASDNWWPNPKSLSLKDRGRQEKRFTWVFC